MAVMQDATAIQRIESIFAAVAPLMDERMRRQWAAAEAKAYGWGGVRAVSVAIGMSPNTIRKGFGELAVREAAPNAPIETRLRRRKREAGRGSGKRDGSAIEYGQAEDSPDLAISDLSRFPVLHPRRKSFAKLDLPTP